MATDRTIWGAGRWIAAVMAPYVSLIAALNRLSFPSLRFPRDRSLARAIGLTGVVAGVGTIAASYRAVRDARDRGELCTDGPYGVVRHPLYAAWIWLLLPGLAVLARLPLVLTASPVMYLVTAYFLPREEATLDAEFGEAYDEYRADVNALVPSIRRS